MMAPNKAGTVKLDVFIKSDSYVGLDIKKAIEFEVISAATLPKYEPHPDDLELDNEPTLFEQVMQAYDDETDSEDEVRTGDGSAFRGVVCLCVGCVKRPSYLVCICGLRVGCYSFVAREKRDPLVRKRPNCRRCPFLC